MAIESKSHISVEINGEAKSLSADCTIRSMLNQLSNVSVDDSNGESAKRKHAAVAVELNLEIVPVTEFDATRLKDGDVVEVVTLVGGG